MNLGELLLVGTFVLLVSTIGSCAFHEAGQRIDSLSSDLGQLRW